jgi:hypothetical protein
MSATDSASPSVVIVPIQIVHGFIFVPATVGGHQGHFILDTGSPTTILNSDHLQQSSSDGFDTVTTKDTARTTPQMLASLTLQIGPTTFTAESAQADFPIVGAMVSMSAHERSLGHPLLGILGLNLFRHNELIIDYVRCRLVLIPVDSAGLRLVAVPKYTPVKHVPILLRNVDGPHWYLPAMLGGVLDTLLIDIGNNLSELTLATQARLTSHVRVTGQTLDVIEEQRKPQLIVDHLGFAGKSYNKVTFYGTHVREDCLGSRFFCQLDVIGFNFPASRIMLYHSSPNTDRR